MALATDLTGLGIPPGPASRIGHPPATNLVGTGTAQAGGKKIPTTSTIAVPVTGQTAYVLGAAADAPAVMKEYYFYNNAATAVTALVYPPTDGSTLNGSTSASVSVAQNKLACFIALLSAAGGVTWASDVTA